MPFAGLVAAGGVYLLGSREEPVRAGLSVAEALGQDTTGYARATGPRDFQFPADHGPHPAFRTEWWYYTGNLASADGEGASFGYQFTLFRTALTPDTVLARASGWATNQLYMAHFAVTDVAEERFYAAERFSRGAAGLAGAQAEPFRVWLEDWSAEAEGAMPRMRLRARQDGAAIDLVLTPLKPIVLQGDRGFDPKSDEPGNASYYYSMTRLATEGSVTTGGRTHAVEGLSWMDREWSTSVLGREQIGWDWFALHLSDGRDLMFYQLRERGGGVSPFTGGVLVAPDGAARHLGGTDVSLGVTATWTSPATGAAYPSGWRLRIPAEDLDLAITPALAAQELDVTVRYWEGAVRVAGTAGGDGVSGNGYVELTGYGECGAQGADCGGVRGTRSAE